MDAVATICNNAAIYFAVLIIHVNFSASTTDAGLAVMNSVVGLPCSKTLDFPANF